MSEMPEGAAVLTAAESRGRIRRTLWRLGQATRERFSFLLMLASLSFGVARDAVRPATWRRTVRFEFRRALRQAIAGGLSATLVTAILIGLAMVSQALYWLGVAGQRDLLGSILVTVLVRELAPLLVGLILLGRSGVVMISEIGALQIGGQVRSLEAQGLDPFQLLLLPRVCALATASFTLGVMFVLTALVTGYIAGSLLGAVQVSLLSFLNRVLLAMSAADFVVVPGKMVSIGFLVALTASLTGFAAKPRDDVTRLLPIGFTRGVVTILLTSIVLSLAV